jgi:Fe2+ or Zn2+ uptake regulation protein
MQDHYHITCPKCGKIEDAVFQPLQDTLTNLENALGNLTKYGIFGHKLEFVGLCSDCKEDELGPED